jgi:hypothetical protein
MVHDFVSTNGGGFISPWQEGRWEDLDLDRFVQKLLLNVWADLTKSGFFFNQQAEQSSFHIE